MMTRDLDLRALNSLAGEISNQVSDFDTQFKILKANRKHISSEGDALRFKSKVAHSKLSDLKSRIRLEKTRLLQTRLVEHAIEHTAFDPLSSDEHESSNPSAWANIAIIEQSRGIQYRKLKAGMARQIKVIGLLHSRLASEMGPDDEMLCRYASFVSKTDAYIDNLFRSIKAKRSTLETLYLELPEAKVYQKARAHLGHLDCDKALAVIRYKSTYLRRKKSKAGL